MDFQQYWSISIVLLEKFIRQTACIMAILVWHGCNHPESNGPLPIEGEWRNGKQRMSISGKALSVVSNSTDCEKCASPSSLLVAGNYEIRNLNHDSFEIEKIRFKYEIFDNGSTVFLTLKTEKGKSNYWINSLESHMISVPSVSVDEFQLGHRTIVPAHFQEHTSHFVPRKNFSVYYAQKQDVITHALELNRHQVLVSISVRATSLQDIIEIAPELRQYVLANQLRHEIDESIRSKGQKEFLIGPVRYLLYQDSIYRTYPYLLTASQVNLEFATALEECLLECDLEAVP